MQQEQRSRVAPQQLARLVDDELESLVEPPEARDVRPDAIQSLSLPDLLLEVALGELQRAIVVLESLGHEVEVLGELTDLVAGRDPDAGFEATLRDAARRGRQPPQRCRDVSVDPDADHHQETDAERQEDQEEGWRSYG